MAPALVGVLEEAQARGYLGPGPIAAHIEHGRELARLAPPPPASFADLGTGGGVPGLVLAEEWAGARVVLVESQRRRCRFLEWAIGVLGHQARATVACGRAEEVARGAEWRGGLEMVVARSFGPPAVTAECAVGLLRPGGRLVVAEPPRGDRERWPATGVAALGLGAAEVRRGRAVTVAVLTRIGSLDERWPRRAGIPAKRPLW